MKSDEKQLLNEWILQQSEFSKNDLLVTINDAKTAVFSETLPLEQLSKIISISQNSIKESGINPFCQVIGILNWEWNNQAVQSPVWIVPCEFQVDRVREIIHLSPQETSGFLNPFLAKKIAAIYDIKLEETNFEETIDQLKKSGFENIDPGFKAVGNFHHHRYVLLKELQELAGSNRFSPGLKQFLSGEKSTDNSLHLPAGSLLPYDTDHRTVFDLFANENCVVQGPPGTGKSQLLTNIIGKLLISNHSTVFVSEKRAALEVIRKRLSFCNLEQLSVIATDDLSVHDFIQELKKTWEFLDDFTPSEQTGFSTRKEQENNLQFVLDILNQPELIGSVSFSKFKELISVFRKGSKEGTFFKIENFSILSNPPSLTSYEHTLSLVIKLYNDKLTKSISILPFSVLKEGNLSRLATAIERTKEIVISLEKIHPDLTQNDVEKLQYLSVVYQLFQNELAKKYASIIEPDSKAQKQFLKLYREYNQLLKQLEISSEMLSDWKVIPSELESDYLLQLSESNSFLQKIKLKKRWSKVNYLPVRNAVRSIGQLKNHRAIQKEKIRIEEKLAKIGITDFSEMDLLKASLYLFSKEKWNAYNDLSTEKRKLLNEINSKINILKEDLRINYRLNKNHPVLRQLNELLKQLPQLIIEEKELSNLNQQILDAFSASDVFEDYQKNILGTHQTIFQSHYPALSAFEPGYLKEKVEALIDAEQKENQLVSETILVQTKTAFEEYNKLLNTPSAKLTEEQKTFKQQLKKGKSILIKEFSKTRKHPALRELMHSEAAIWIRLLKPVWLTNPAQLAKTFPLEKELFDVCIMDEASQMPIQNGAGALQRSKRVIIAGDEQQMNPASYFQAGSKEVTSVLQHASFYLPKATLTHHYRSKHAPLIAFSNRYFYDNKLVVYPSFPIDANCIKRHFCSGGKYIDRKNNEEAKRTVEIITQRLKSGKTIGVVTFSQEQTDAIWKALPSELSEEILNRIEQNTLFIKPLEKVQGDECEHLVISLGYAPDENGNFHLRFGPLNTGSGRNRLNVLFSRASETIDFVCSIESPALQWSENESIQLLYKWLRNLEQTQSEQNISFPLGLIPEIDGNRLIFKDSYAVLPDALEFLTTYSVLKRRGWEVQPGI